MKKRPLCYLCLAFLLLKAVFGLVGGAKFEPKLRLSPIEESGLGGEQILTEGRVYKKEEKEKYQLIYLKNISIVHSGQKIKESKIIIYDDKFTACRIGNTLEVKGELGFFETPGNPGNFDQHFYYQKQDIHASVWASGITVLNNHENKVMENLFQIRHYWQVVLYHAMGEEEGAILSAVLLGEKGGMDPELKELYQKNGIGHILAISGLHISFLGLGFYHLMRKAGGSCLAAGAAAMAVLGLYVLMIGPGVSSIRAFVMLLIRVVADLTGRVYDMATSIAVAAAGIILFGPLYLYDAGFLLSFGAVAGVAVIHPYIILIFGSWEKEEGKKIGTGVKEGLLAGLSINLAILPAMMYYFFEFPIWSFLLNLAVIPLMSLLLTLAAAGSVMSLVSLQAGKVILSGCRAILKFYELLCRITIQIPFGRIVTGKPGAVQILLYYAGILVILGAGVWLDRRKRAGDMKDMREKRFIRPVILLWILVLCVILMTGHGKNGEMTVTVADVGQGDGIYVRGPEGVRYFFDGGSSDVKELGEYRLEPFLKSQGTGTLDYVFISHGDADHMNGIEEMLDRQEYGVKIRHLVLPPKKFQDEALKRIAGKAESEGIKVLQMKEGDTVSEGKMEIRCLFPGMDFDGETGNESSLVFQISFGKMKMLMTGDVEGSGEEVLTDSGLLSEALILKVAHHGSKNSTTEKFLEKVKPKYALISAGKDNRYGHPHKELLGRLEEAGCQILQTPAGGAIEIWTDGEQMTVDTFRGEE